VSTIAEKLGAWIVSAREFPDRVRQRARWQAGSVVAAVHAGMTSAPALAVLETVKKRAHAGKCTVFPTGEKLALEDALTIQSALSMALDYDDYLFMGHTGHSAVLASWAIAEELGLGGKELLEAQIVANEIAGRVGASVVLGPQNGQAWSFIHAAAGAALGARLYGLSATQAAHALAIAMYQPTFTLWPGFMGGDAKVLTAAGPTLTGVQAAQLAAGGLTGALDILEHPKKGFLASFSFAALPDAFDGLGEEWVTDTLAFKKYPGCAYIDTTMDALFDALAHAGGAKIESVDIDAGVLTVEMDNLARDHRSDRLEPVNINFSIPQNVAIALVAGRHGPRELTRAFLDANDARIRELAGRVTLRHDWAMTGETFRAFASVLRPRLGAGDIARVIAGFLGQRTGSRRLGALHLRQAFQKIPPRVPLKDFRMVFPSQVTLHTDRGDFQARRDVPSGAPGAGDEAAVVAAKLRAEAPKIRFPEIMDAFESRTIQELSSAASA
jgi:2-methylcitrate dehydratase PrpD